jgi:hypothetical protein
LDRRSFDAGKPKRLNFMRTPLSRFSAISIVTATLAFVGCSTAKPIVSEWSNPGYTAPSFKRIMVGGVGGQTSVRRNFEDEFVAQLRVEGVDALPSYRYVREDENIEEAKLKEAARAAGADAAILVRSVNVEQKTELGPSYYPTPSFGFFGGNFAAAWYGLYGAPSVYRYNEYTSETTLYDLTNNAVVWTGTIRTTEPDNVNTAIKSYVQAVITALNQKNLLGVKK